MCAFFKQSTDILEHFGGKKIGAWSFKWLLMLVLSGFFFFNEC